MPGQYDVTRVGIEARDEVEDQAIGRCLVQQVSAFGAGKQTAIEGVAVTAKGLEIRGLALGGVGHKFSDAQLADDGVIGRLAHAFVISQVRHGGQDVGLRGGVDTRMGAQHAVEQGRSRTRRCDYKEKLILQGLCFPRYGRRPGSIDSRAESNRPTRSEPDLGDGRGLDEIFSAPAFAPTGAVSCRVKAKE